MNTFGRLFRMTTWGESHGKAIGSVVDGCPAGLELKEEDIQKELNRRRPGFSEVSTKRKEKDEVQILSGVLDDITLGTPISMLIWNRDVNSTPYGAIRHLVRPGHADLTYWEKFKIRDWRGGGRSSARETAARVAAGAIAKKILRKFGVEVIGHTIEVAGIKAEEVPLERIKENRDKNPVLCADIKASAAMVEKILEVKEEGDSVGGIAEIIIHNPPAGLGEPVFLKLDAYLSQAIMSVGAVKAVEFGAGFHISRMKGSEANDPIKMENERPTFVSNNAGGILGGISTGQDIVIRVAIKPTPSVSKPQRTINIKTGEDEEIIVQGRHDPCIVPRIIPVLEAMAAMVMVDSMMMQGLIPRSFIDK